MNTCTIPINASAADAIEAIKNALRPMGLVVNVVISGAEYVVHIAQMEP